jgi:hypothetical protein
VSESITQSAPPVLELLGVEVVAGHPDAGDPGGVGGGHVVGGVPDHECLVGG